METTQCFVLNTQSYSESSVIFRAICQNSEFKSFIIKGARQKKKSNKNAIVAPLVNAELVYYPSRKSEMSLVKESKILNPTLIAKTDVNTLCLRQFTAEVLFVLAHQQPSESEVFDLATWANHCLIDAADNSEMPIHLLLHIMHFQGITPDSTYFLKWIKDSSPFKYCDLSNTQLEMFFENKYDGTQLRNGKERISFLNQLLAYLSQSTPGFDRLKSLPVLHSILE